MRIFSAFVFGLVNWAARKGVSLHSVSPDDNQARQNIRLTGIRGETFAYWYLRRHGYIIISRNFRAPGVKGEIDLIGFDGPNLAFIEVKTRTGSDQAPAGMPEDAVTRDKRRILSRMVRQFLMDRRLKNVNWRYDVLAIQSQSGSQPRVRLHKGAFTDR
ncbi:MAG TPA: YraN family protein [Candidatus Acidoferrales bacterium]|jgi:putative endonuclease|nr:YraN family protein [Candidatus Acidoferrales bacterium]